MRITFISARRKFLIKTNTANYLFIYADSEGLMAGPNVYTCTQLQATNVQQIA